MNAAAKLNNQGNTGMTGGKYLSRAGEECGGGEATHRGRGRRVGIAHRITNGQASRVGIAHLVTNGQCKGGRCPPYGWIIPRRMAYRTSPAVS